MHQAGLLNRALQTAKKKVNRGNPCSILSKQNGMQAENAKSIAMKLRDFVGAFVVMVVGFVSALLVLIFEFFTKLITKK